MMVVAKKDHERARSPDILTPTGPTPESYVPLLFLFSLSLFAFDSPILFHLTSH